jgi:quercetin dioxygenase-like cupin family protein
MVTFLFGMLCGRCIPGQSTHYKLRITSGSIHRLADTAVRNTSHTDANNQPITKQQLIEPFDVPNLAGFSVATLLPGQRVYSHDHRSMHEFFFILEGKVLFTINGKETLVEKGTMVHVTPYELHQLDAPFDSSVIMLVSGITVEDR